MVTEISGRKRPLEHAAKVKLAAERALVKWRNDVNPAEESIDLLSIAADKIKKELLDHKFQSAENHWNVLKGVRDFVLSQIDSSQERSSELTQARKDLSKAKQQARALQGSGNEV